jgi:hypothetical protein
MKLYLFSTAMLLSFFCSAQDLDFQDTRRKNEGFARLQPKEIRDEVATFALAGISESVNAVPLHKIPYQSFGTDSMTFQGDRIKAIIKIAPFDPAKHKLTYDEKHLVKIDKKTYYGDYGKIPKTYISNVTLIVRGDTFQLPPAAYDDLYNLNLTYSDKGVQRTTNAIYISRDTQRIYLYLFSKDNSGSYEVTWIIQDMKGRKYLRRVLDYGFM